MLITHNIIPYDYLAIKGVLGVAVRALGDPESGRPSFPCQETVIPVPEDRHSRAGGNPYKVRWQSVDSRLRFRGGDNLSWE